MAKLVFEEQQRFNKWWMTLILGVVLLIFVRMLFRIIDAGPLDDRGIIVILVAIIPAIALTILIFFIELKSRIDESGIHAYFSPFGIPKKSILWNDIRNVEVVRYNALKEYGGWGYRVSFKGKTAMNVKGNMGIKIFLENGKQFLIGTQRPEEAKKILESYMNSSSQS